MMKQANAKDIENLNNKIRKFVLIEIFRTLSSTLAFFLNMHSILTPKLTVYLNHRISFKKRSKN